MILTSIALIAFGAAMVLSSNSVWKLHQLKRTMLPVDGQSISGTAILANEMASEFRWRAVAGWSRRDRARHPRGCGLEPDRIDPCGADRAWRHPGFDRQFAQRNGRQLYASG